MQAVIILAHKDMDQLYALCDKLRSKFLIYVHLDKNIVAQLSRQKSKIFIMN